MKTAYVRLMHTIAANPYVTGLTIKAEMYDEIVADLPSKNVKENNSFELLYPGDKRPITITKADK